MPEVTRAQFVEAVKEFKRQHQVKLKSFLGRDEKVTQAFLMNPIIRGYLQRASIAFSDKHPSETELDPYELKLYRQLPDKIALRNGSITSNAFYTNGIKPNAPLFKAILDSFVEGSSDIKVTPPDSISSLAIMVAECCCFPAEENNPRFILQANWKDDHATVCITIIDSENQYTPLTLFLNSRQSEEYYQKMKDQFPDFYRMERRNLTGCLPPEPQFIDVSHHLQLSKDDENCVLYGVNIIEAISAMLKQPENAENVFQLARATMANSEQARTQLIDIFKNHLKSYLPCYYDTVTHEAKSPEEREVFHLNQRWQIGRKSIDLLNLSPQKTSHNRPEKFFFEDSSDKPDKDGPETGDFHLSKRSP